MKRINLSSLFFIALILVSCKSKNQNQTDSVDNHSQIAVHTSAVEKLSTQSQLQISGNIEGAETVKLGFMVAGKINQYQVKEGELVSKGQLIAALDPSNYAIAKEMADVQVAQSTDEYNRLKMMFDRNSLSEADFKKISFAVDQAKSQQKLQAKNLSDTRLYAPLNAVVVKKLNEVGEIISPGMPVIVLSNINTVKVNAYIPENELQKIKIGQQTDVYIAAVDSTFSGKITEVGAAADPSSRAFTAKVELPNPKHLIRPGMIAELRIATAGSRELIAIPADCVLHDINGESYVYIADKSQNKAFKRKVSLGQLIQSKIEVLSGLELTDLLITAGQNKLADGSSIQIVK